MPGNFAFLEREEQFAVFAGLAVAAEHCYAISAAGCAANCRNAMEAAVKWLYSADGSLKPPYDDNLASLVNAACFQELMDDTNMRRRLEFLRMLGNAAAHNPKSVTRDKALLALQNLHVFLDWIAYCYGGDYEESVFDAARIPAGPRAPAPAAQQARLESLMAENARLKKELTNRRALREVTYTPKPVDMSEAATRKAYIDVMLGDAGWARGRGWVDEYRIDEMPNHSGVGYADYVLFGDDGRPLAVVEAKRTCKDVAAGRQQAVLYADFLEKKFARRPVIFLTNGFDTKIWDDRHYPERRVSGIYSKRDLEKLFNIRAGRRNLERIQVSDAISNRYYQKEAVKAVCEAFDEKNRRRALLVMATGSGKTRTVISLADVLIRRGWVKNLLFLADRTALVRQAKRHFVNLLPDLSTVNLVEEKENAAARAVFSTYQTMMGCIDETRDEAQLRLFTPGHFDLIVVDEAHRSIYNKYKDIFTYFDALLVGLTATPKDEIDKNTYGIFALEPGVPTYGYELKQAVEDGYLVDFSSIETKLKFMHEGIAYDSLREEEREEYEAKFTDEDGELPESIGGAALNAWIFNADTIKQVLRILMERGLKVDYGNKLGKTIIFARNHDHAEKIREVWGREYPHYPSHFCRVIDNYTSYAQSLVDDFSEKDKLPQVAVSVDMLDTGIDVPEILNLVFFKKVMSKAKFWQMIGRGTRLCPGLLDGEDKREFYIFDFCGNFEFFRLHAKGREAPAAVSLSQRLFNLKTELAYQLQKLPDMAEVRAGLVDELAAAVKNLDRNSFAVKQHMRYAEAYGRPEGWAALTYENTLRLAEHLAPLMEAVGGDPAALRFDALLYQLELAIACGANRKRAQVDLQRRAAALAGLYSIPEVKAREPVIQAILLDGLEDAHIPDYERIRRALRGLMKYIPPNEMVKYDTDFRDTILESGVKPSSLDSDDLENYRKKVNYYIRTNDFHPAIAKLKGNVPLTPTDLRQLEDILWGELGTRQQYEREYGQTPLGVLVRSVVGLDISAANEAFSRYLDHETLDSRQVYFVKQVVNYVVKNGVMADLSVLQRSPFNDQGSLARVFDDNPAAWRGIRAVIERINKNAQAA